MWVEIFLVLRMLSDFVFMLEILRVDYGTMGLFKILWIIDLNGLRLQVLLFTVSESVLFPDPLLCYSDMSCVCTV